jgi:hypothetical protein
MENNTDIYGNMGDYITSQKRVEKYQEKPVLRKPKSGLVKKIIFGTLILGALTGVGIGTYKLADYAIKADNANSLKTPNFHDEPVYERRVKLLNQAEKQLISSKNPNDSRGIMALIRDIEKGVYDYQK